MSERLQLRNETTFCCRKNVCFSLCIEKKFVGLSVTFFCESPLNRDALACSVGVRINRVPLYIFTSFKLKIHFAVIEQKVFTFTDTFK